MRKPTLLIIALALVPILLVAAPGIAGGLDAVAQFVPEALQNVTLSYTDWDAIKSAVGVSWLTSAASFDMKLAFGRRLDQDHAAAAAFGLSRLRDHAEAWGFDTLDLEWEAQLFADGIAPVYLLKLPEAFDLDPLLERFAARGFAQTDSYGAMLFSRNAELGQTWTRTTELAIHNTGILLAERLLILSASPGAVEILLATGAGEIPSLVEDASFQRSVAQLDEPLAATILRGRATCLRFSPNPLLDHIGTTVGDSALEALRTWFESGDPLHGYQLFAVAYHSQDDGPSWTIVFDYASTDDAEADLDPRRLLASSASSTHFEEPIVDVFFTLEDAAVDETSIVFNVRPAYDQPKRLFQMVWYADAPFAACR